MPRKRIVSGIVVDTQEVTHGYAWTFPDGVSITVKSLQKYGVDYMPYGFAGKIGVERKSMDDWIKCLGKDWRRLIRNQVSKLLKMRFRAIIVEGTPSKINRYSKLTRAGIVDKTSRVVAMGVPVLYYESSGLASYGCLRFFHYAIKTFQEERYGD